MGLGPGISGTVGVWGQWLKQSPQAQWLRTGFRLCPSQGGGFPSPAGSCGLAVVEESMASLHVLHRFHWSGSL